MTAVTGLLMDIQRDHRTTLLFISHDVGDTLDFERVLVIAEGGIVDAQPLLGREAQDAQLALVHVVVDLERGLRQRPALGTAADAIGLIRHAFCA